MYLDERCPTCKQRIRVRDPEKEVVDARTKLTTSVDHDPFATGVCGCGQPYPHGGMCTWRYYWNNEAIHPKLTDEQLATLRVLFVKHLRNVGERAKDRILASTDEQLREALERMRMGRNRRWYRFLIAVIEAKGSAKKTAELIRLSSARGSEIKRYSMAAIQRRLLHILERDNPDPTPLEELKTPPIMIHSLSQTTPGVDPERFASLPSRFKVEIIGNVARITKKDPSEVCRPTNKQEGTHDEEDKQADGRVSG